MLHFFFFFNEGFPYQSSIHLTDSQLHIVKIVFTLEKVFIFFPFFPWQGPWYCQLQWTSLRAPWSWSSHHCLRPPRRLFRQPPHPSASSSPSLWGRISTQTGISFHSRLCQITEGNMEKMSNLIKYISWRHSMYIFSHLHMMSLLMILVSVISILYFKCF